MRTLPPLATVGCALIAVAGCGTPHTGQAASTSALAAPSALAVGSPQAGQAAYTSAPASPSAPAAGSPHQRAVADAARIMASFPVPPGAARSARPPSPLLVRPAVGPAITSDVVTVTRWWTAPGQPQSVLAWVAAHMPAQFTRGGAGATGSGPCVAYGAPPGTPYPCGWLEQFSLPAVPDVLTERVLVVEVVRAGSDRTAIRADASVIWLPAKPATEQIPPDATVVTVAPQVSVGPVPASQRLADRTVTITDPATVARIAALVDGLPVFPPGTYMCPADYGWGIRLTFRARLDGPVLALVTGDQSGCQMVSVVINGERQLPLADGGSLETQVLEIAGVRWPYPPQPPVSPTHTA